MILKKEIEMDLPPVRDTNQEHLSADAIKLDYELNWKEKKKTISINDSMYDINARKIIPRINTKDCWENF